MSSTYGPNAILQNSTLAAEIGNVCANWSLIKSDLVFLYGLVMGDYLPKREGFSPPTHPVARQVFDALNAFAPKLELLSKLLAWRIPPDLYAQFKASTVPKLRKRYSERSTIAHGLWGICSDHPDSLILMPTYGTPMIYKRRDFEDISTRILEEHVALGSLGHTLYEQRSQRT